MCGYNQEVIRLKEKNYTPLIALLTIVLVGIIAVLFFLPAYEGEVQFDVTILPLLNAIFNCFTFLSLCVALAAIRKKNVRMHRAFIGAAFTSTTLFLVSYVTYHYLTESTKYGGEGFLRPIYFFILLTHILLAIVVVPLALISVVRGLQMQIEKHRKIARWTMPIWLYVSLTGVIVYLMISPYY
jgi:putative membrane protein